MLLNLSLNAPLMQRLCCHHLAVIVPAVSGVAVKAVNQCFTDIKWVKSRRKEKKSKVDSLFYPQRLTTTLDFSFYFFLAPYIKNDKAGLYFFLKGKWFNYSTGWITVL